MFHPPALPPPTQHTPPLHKRRCRMILVHGTQDLRQLCELLGRSNSEAVMPLKRPSRLSQAVMLMLAHRLAGSIDKGALVDESFKYSMCGCSVLPLLNTNGPLIAPHTARILSSVRQMRQRIAILPGAPMARARAISEICVLRREEGIRTPW
ncbi:hypothetical protein BGY98DRAFT_387102 [Russula aff. rugulosa BPL654]|nr:hypothetical protein BGY98DRAFT_387102 [Russula aff. rugulosa BPL654]